MLRVSDMLRDKWGTNEEMAVKFLLEKGWEKIKGVWYLPKDKSRVTEDEWEALQFLISEWYHAYGGVLE